MSTAPIITDLQSINPSAVIELFELTPDATLHGSTQTYRFHAGSNLNLNGKLVFGGNEYLRFPVTAEGFAYQRGQIPRPSLSVSNALGTITAILLNVNAVTTGNDLTGATVKRIRTSARYIDAVNFPVTTTSSTTTSTIADPADAESVTYTVTVVNVGGSNYFALNGVTNPTLTFVKGGTYIFQQHDYSNAGHPIGFRETDDTAYTAGVSTVGTAGSGNAATTFTVPSNAPSSLKYYCSVHGNSMGNNITISNYTNPDANAAIRFPDDVYYIDRKSLENRQLVEFELAAVFDLSNVKIPKRQALPSLFPGIGSFHA